MLILHLSDIHFRKHEVKTAQDPNFHLRNELVRDIVAQCRHLGPPDIIIVSGDVAFAGDPDEFAFATEWLRKLCDECSGSLETVFVCPGNHDVVRSTAGSYMVQLVHLAIKGAANVEQELSRQLRDIGARRILYESLDNYNAFALQFFCDLLPPERTRARRDVPLNDGSTLRLWGLNTAFVSSEHDRPGDLFVDPASFQIPREDGVVNLVVAHHHLSWLRQQQELADHLNDVAPIQIFGHIHTNRIEMNVDYMRLTASAAHPDRNEFSWEPGYNLIEVEVEGGPDDRKLHLRTHVRIWRAAPGGFQVKMYKNSDVWEHRIALEHWQQARNGGSAHAILANEPCGDGDPTAPDEGGSAMNTLRDLGLRFYRLSFSKKSEIAGRLSLLEDDDMAQPDFERFRRVFLRANDRGMLQQLSDAVRAAEQR